MGNNIEGRVGFALHEGRFAGTLARLDEADYGDGAILLEPVGSELALKDDYIKDARVTRLDQRFASSDMDEICLFVSKRGAKVGLGKGRNTGDPRGYLPQRYVFRLDRLAAVIHLNYPTILPSKNDSVFSQMIQFLGLFFKLCIVFRLKTEKYDF
jgi:hypothetical protein